MDSKKLELEKRLSTLDGFTKLEEFIYRSTLSKIFYDAKINVFIVKEFLRHYCKSVKVVKHAEIFIKESGDYEVKDCISKEMTLNINDIIWSAIDSVAIKVYESFIEKLDYFLENGKIKLTEYGDYEHDPDDYKLEQEPEPKENKDADYSELWENYENKSFKYCYEGCGQFTEYYSYQKSEYPITICNAEYNDLNLKYNEEFLEKCKMYSTSLKKFKKYFIKDFKNNLSRFGRNCGFQSLFFDIVICKVFSNNNSLNESEKYCNLKKCIDLEYSSCDLNFELPYLTEVNEYISERREKIQYEINELNSE